QLRHPARRASAGRPPGLAAARAARPARRSRPRHRRRDREAGQAPGQRRAVTVMTTTTAAAPAAPTPVVPNPLREGLAVERIPEPATMVIFGASGDLTKRKLLPALYSLTRERLLPGRFAVVGYARRPLTDDAFRDEMRAGCDELARRRPVDPEFCAAFARNIYYQDGG